MVTCAPTIRAPCGSLRVPAIRPVVGLCATVADVYSVLSKQACSNAISVFENLAFGRGNFKRESHSIWRFPSQVLNNVFGNQFLRPEQRTLQTKLTLNEGFADYASGAYFGEACSSILRDNPMAQFFARRIFNVFCWHQVIEK